MGKDINIIHVYKLSGLMTMIQNFIDFSSLMMYSVIIMQSRSRKCVNLLKNALYNNKFYDEVLFNGRIMGSGT